MIDPERLAGFIPAVLALVLLPGPNTIVILSQSMSGRKSAALAAVAGVELGTLVHTLIAATGVALLFEKAPAVLMLLRLAGAGYLTALGLHTITSPSAANLESAVIGPGPAFRRGLTANVLNPKVALFFIAFIPQFIDHSSGRIFEQFIVLGLVVSLAGWCAGSALALSAAALAGVLEQSGSYRRWQPRVSGMVLVIIGISAGVAAVMT